MIVLRLIGKILAVPLIIITAVAEFLINTVMSLSGVIWMPLLAIIIGCDIYYLIMMRWPEAFVSSLITGGFLLILFAASFVIAVLSLAKDGLIRFLCS